MAPIPANGHQSDNVRDGDQRNPNFAQRAGIRSRVNRFSASVMSLLNSAEGATNDMSSTPPSSLPLNTDSDEKMRGHTGGHHPPPGPRTGTVLASKIVVSLFSLSFCFVILSFLLSSLGVKVNIPISERLMSGQGISSGSSQNMSLYTYSSGRSLSVYDYPLVLVNQSEPHQSHNASGDSRSASGHQKAEHGSSRGRDRQYVNAPKVEEEEDADEGSTLSSVSSSSSSEDEVYHAPAGGASKSKEVDSVSDNDNERQVMNKLKELVQQQKQNEQTEEQQRLREQQQQEQGNDEPAQDGRARQVQLVEQDRNAGNQSTEGGGVAEAVVSADDNSDDHEVVDRDVHPNAAGEPVDQQQQQQQPGTERERDPAADAAGSANATQPSVDGGGAEEASASASSTPAARLIVLTMNRAASLRRLLQSLARANYGDDVVDLDVWIDRGENASAVDAAVLDVARNVSWQHGTKVIHKRTSAAGLYQQWLYTWNVTHDAADVVVILEDDLQVSVQFYQWLKAARAAYADDPEVAAFTLQRPTLRPRQRKGVASGPLNISAAKHPVFKYRLLGTWGFSPLRQHWAEFRAWFELSRVRGDKPYVDGLITTDWYRRQEGADGFAPHMWSQWWIKFADLKNYFTVTPNLPDGTTLAANWREPGLHYSKTTPSADFALFQGTPDQFVIPARPACVDWDGLILNECNNADGR